MFDECTRLKKANLNSFSLCSARLLQQHNKSCYAALSLTRALSPRVRVRLCAQHSMLKYVLRIDVLKPELYNSSKPKWPYHFNGFKINAYTYENFHVWWAHSLSFFLLLFWRFRGFFPLHSIYFMILVSGDVSINVLVYLSQLGTRS